MNSEPVVLSKFASRTETQTSAAIAPEALLEQMKLFQRNFLQGSFVNVPGLFIFGATLWNIGARTWVIAWVLIAAGLDIIDQILARREFRRTPLTIDSAPRYARRFTFSLALAGAMWACAGFFIGTTSASGYQLWIIAALAIVQFSTCTGCAGYLPAIYWFIGPITLSLVLNLVLFSVLPISGYYIALGVLTAVTANLMFSHNYQRILTNSILLNIRNRELAAENAEKKDEAERANRSKSAFLASASHDLRQPMQAIRLLVANLYSTDRTSDWRILLDRVRDSVEAMGSQLDFLLDISRLDTGTVKPFISDFPLDPLIRRLQLQYEPLALAKALVLEVEPMSINVKSDPDLLERILQNLLSNAIRFTDKGSISLRCRQIGDFIDIAISDTGIGIPASELESIFDLLKQLNNPERDHRKGTGLGLGIVDRLAKLLDHKVIVTSELGKGSCFRVRVPVATSFVVEPIAASGTADISVAGAFIVIVEDNPTILESLARLLVNWECPVVGARTGLSAVAALAEHDRAPDLIISDYRLPHGETGLEAIVAIRSVAGASTPAIVVSGDTDPELSEKISTLGMTMLRKPVTPAGLKQAMAAALASP